MSPTSNLGGVQVTVIHSNCHRDHDDDSCNIDDDDNYHDHRGGGDDNGGDMTKVLHIYDNDDS